MADLKNTGNTPAVSADADNNPHAFNFAHMGKLLHAAAHLGAVQPLAATVLQHHAYCSSLQAVDDAVTCMQRTQKGLEMLLDMLEGSGLDRYAVEGLRGLLGPMAMQLEQQAVALGATMARQGDEVRRAQA